MPSKPSVEVHVKITGADGKTTLVVENPGVHQVPPSAGIPVTVSKGASSQTLGVHGTVTNTSVVFDNPGQ